MTGDGSAGRFDVVVLAGGGARRLSGRDKPGLVIGGRPIIESVVAAGTGAGAGRVIVVGPRRDGLGGAVFVSEEPPGAGPVPALRRGLAEVSAPQVAVLAADLPFLRAGHILALLRAAGNGAVLADDGGREQWLAGCWQTAVLRAALDGYQGTSLRGVLGPLGPARLELVQAGEPPPWLDCDTPEDVKRALSYLVLQPHFIRDHGLLARRGKRGGMVVADPANVSRRNSDERAAVERCGEP
jgi:molybdenum cofactor guanylyltransferase